MSRAALSVLVRRTVAEVLGEDESDIGEQTSLESDFQVDSLELMEMGGRLEQALHIRLDVRRLAGVRTVGDAVDLLAEYPWETR